MRKKESLNLEKAFRAMPKVKHTYSINEDGTSDYSESELVKWLLANPHIQQYLVFRCMSSKYTKFDRETRTWEGICDAEIEEAPAKKVTETMAKRMAREFDEAFEQLNVNGKMKILDYANHVGVTKRTAIDRVKRNKAFVYEDGLIRRKE
jgi:hypothetical protein